MPASSSIPPRIRWATQYLAVEPADAILEIGCGVGVAAGLVCDDLTGGGRLTAIDRSPTAIERTRKRNSQHLATGRLTVEQSDLAGFTGSGAPFDKAFAVNVNVFWTSAATREIERLHDLLRPGGWVALVYESPDFGRMRRELAPSIVDKLTAGGFDCRIEAEAGVCAVVGSR